MILVAACVSATECDTVPASRWGLVNLSAASFRSAPGHSSELATQGVYGTPVRLTGKEGEWWKAVMPDGYEAYVVESSVVEMTDSAMARWRNADRVVVTSNLQTYAYADSLTGSPIVTDLVAGCLLEGKKLPGAKFVEVTLPDGRKGYVEAGDVIKADDWATRNFDASVILEQAEALTGLPYLWGGTTTKALDCSGLTKVCYLNCGIILMRDASQQALTGEEIGWPEDLQPADLLFFGNADGTRITHVGLYQGEGMMIHASGNVHVNSLDPESDRYVDRQLLKAVRIAGHEDSPGITRVRNHPWYFDKTNL